MKKILIIQSASIGDVILATPLVEKLHHVFPEAAIDFLVKKGNENLFQDHPFLHEVLVWDKKYRSYMNFDKLMHRVWSTRYDLVVNVQRFLLTGLMTAFSRAQIKTGFDKNPMSFLFTRKIRHRIGEGVHEVDRNLALIEEFPDPHRYLPRLYPSKEDHQKVEPYKTRPYYTLSPASLWFTKQFPAEKWIELINHIPADKAIYLLGAHNDHALCEDIRLRSGHPATINLCGQLSFLQSAALMQYARMNFTNDSAPMHLASAVNAPVTVIYCSTVPEFGFGPLSDNAEVVEVPEKLPCRPCGLHGYSECPEKHFKCAITIPGELLINRL
ncbi:MAG: glycosyltransferase family 9 protein [Bacteroidales bacterium]|jgi:heptosyltransferase-2|nr:glycosyltransferase family 9 protein [Bacteroidales bacterium]